MSEQTQSLSLEKPKKTQAVEYSAKKGKALFNFKFIEDTELSGYMKLRVWVEARSENTGDISPDDMALFVAINKLDRDGRSVHFNGSVGIMMDMVTRGCCRVSRR